MATEGPNSPSSVVDDDAFGTEIWFNPGNATASDDSFATVALGVGEISHYLEASNFGFSIPGGATIDGIVVEFERKGTLGDVILDIKDERVRIVKGGVVSSTAKSAAALWPTTEETKSFGSSSDLWGETWIASDINNTSFGVVIAAIDNSGEDGTGSVDHIKITVTYTPSSPLIVQNILINQAVMRASNF